MEQKEFSELLLLTAFSVMACDGDIDPQEVNLISKLEKEESLFNIQDMEDRLNQLVNEINKDGHGFLKNYFQKLKAANLSLQQEIKLVDITIKMIEADDVVLYNELRFFKIIHSYLNISSDEIMANFSHVDDIEDYVVQDIISEKYIEKLTSNYFNNQAIPDFASIKIQTDEQG